MVCITIRTKIFYFPDNDCRVKGFVLEINDDTTGAILLDMHENEYAMLLFDDKLTHNNEL